MATVSFRGDAVTTPQVTTVTPVAANATAYTLTVNGKNITYTSDASGTVAEIVTGLQAAWAASEEGEISEITATDNTTLMTLTGPDSGKPFTVTSTGAGTLNLSTTTAASSPNHWNKATNWSGGAVPVTGVNEQQTVTVDATAGNFKVIFGAQTTAATAFNAAASTLQTNLEALSTIGAGNITVSGGPGAAGGGTPYTLVFTGSLGYQNVAQVTCDNDTLSGGASTATPATTVAGSAGDDVVIEDTDVDIKWELDQSAVILNSLTIKATYTGKIGLPKYDEDGDYYQYKDRYLKIGVSGSNGVTEIGGGEVGAGSSRIMINFGSVRTNLRVYNSSEGENANLPAILVSGTNAYNALEITEGSLGIAVEVGQTSTFLTSKVGFENTIGSDVFVIFGSGCTLTTLTMTGGEVEINSAITTINKTGGKITLRGSGNITTLNNDSGLCIDWNTGTKTTVNVSEGEDGPGIIDRKGTQLTTTYTNCNLYKGAELYDPNEGITFTNAFAVVRCKLKDIVLDLGHGFSLQRS